MLFIGGSGILQIAMMETTEDNNPLVWVTLQSNESHQKAPRTDPDVGWILYVVHPCSYFIIFSSSAA